MEQRRLRLGDILDDYCPRERRVTNHAVVAMIEDDVKQTRCTTCDAEHAYKGGKAPRRKKKDATGTLYKEVLAGITESDPTPVLTVPAPASDMPEPHSDSDEYAHEPVEAAESIEVSESEPEHPVEDAQPLAAEDDDRQPQVEDGPVHRQLIRATLPRPEGQKDARPLPEFTIRSRGNGNFRGDNRGGGGGGRPRTGQGGSNGHRQHGGQRFAGPRPSGRGPGNRGQGGFRPSQPQRHGGKKRSR
jgi:hypothetical protein